MLLLLLICPMLLASCCKKGVVVERVVTVPAPEHPPCPPDPPPDVKAWKTVRQDGGCPEGLVCYLPADDANKSEAVFDLDDYAWKAWLCDHTPGSDK
jgi:hypothetical protein